jgi:glycosyltransferase involved in cell wall biosynthesis
VRSLPDLLVELHLYAITQSEKDREYLEDLKTLAANDFRIHFLPSVPSQRAISVLRNYDLLAAPSRCLETGPFVVLEAFAAGIPVIGSNLGGIAELITDGKNGMIVTTESVQAWTDAIRSCCDDHALLDRLRRGITQPRQMPVVAEEMLSLYHTLLKLRRPHREHKPEDLRHAAI